MTQQTVDIPGLPEGWKSVSYRCPEGGEYYLENNGIVIKHTGCKHKFPWIIVEKIQPRRIVLEETEEGDHTVAFHNDDGEWTYWKEVKE